VPGFSKNVYTGSLAIALSYSLNKSHPFQDGNKHTSDVALLMCFVRNGFDLDVSVDERERVILGVADGSIDRDKFNERVCRQFVRCQM
jgi:death on curing protein